MGFETLRARAVVWVVLLAAGVGMSVATRSAADGAGGELERRGIVPLLARDAGPPAVATMRFDFESGGAPWELESGIWTVEPIDGSQALVGNGHGFARLDGLPGTVSRMQFRLQLRDETSGIHASLFETFATGHTRYFVAFRPTSVSIFLQRGESFERLGEEPVQLPIGEMTEVAILIGGGSLDVFVDGEPVLGADDRAGLPPGPASFESLGGPVAIDDVEIAVGGEQAPHPHAPRSAESYPAGPDVGPFLGGQHSGDIVLSGSDVLTLSSGRYTVRAGNVIIRDTARLRIEQGAALVFDRDTSPLIHWGVDLSQSGSLELDGGSMLAAEGTLVRVNAFGTSGVEIVDARPRIHFINAGGDASVRIAGSRFLTAIGGSVQLSDRVSVDITDSQVGAIALFIRGASGLRASGLRPGSIPDFDLQRDLTPTEIGYNLRLRNVDLVADTLGEGPFERGWVIIADESAAVELSASTLRKMVFEFPTSGPPVAVTGLRLDAPTDLAIGNVRLTGVTVTGQWGFFLHADRQATFDDCRALWFFVFDSANVLLRNSTMNEFDPRHYQGVFRFENGRWSTAGEIIEGNDFVMEGTYEVDAGAESSLSWSASQVRRRFPVEVRDGAGQASGGVEVTAQRGTLTRTATTDASGFAVLELAFNDADYALPWEVSAAGGPAVQVGFFSTTPLQLVVP